MRSSFCCGSLLILVAMLSACGGGGGTAPPNTDTGGSNQAPTADAGSDQSINEGSSVQLSGSGNDPEDGTNVSFQWSQTSGTNVVLSDTTAAGPTFTAPSIASGAETLTFRLVVTDTDALESTPDTVDITVNDVPPANQAPTADAGPDQLNRSTDFEITLDGSGSNDPEGSGLTYQWAFTPPVLSGATLSSNTVSGPTFTPDTKGQYFGDLTVNDGSLDSSPDSVMIWITNTRPVASIAVTGIILPGNTIAAGTIELDGTGSSDADAGDTLTYAWAFIPSGSTVPGVTLSSATAQKPTFAGSSSNTYLFGLTVNDGTVDSRPATTTINVLP